MSSIKPTLLLVEPDPLQCAALSTLLTPAFSLTTCADLRAAFTHLETASPAPWRVLLTELSGFAEGHGYDLIEAARQEPRFDTTLIAVLTMRLSIDAISDTMRRGVDSIYVTPVNSLIFSLQIQLLARINRPYVLAQLAKNQ